MIVTKKAISRRTILRGMGATVALPLLDAMIPALTAAAEYAGESRPSPGRRLPSERRHLRQMAPEGRGGQFRVVADACRTAAVQGPADRGHGPLHGSGRGAGRRRRRSFPRERRLSERRAREEVRCGRRGRHLDGPDCRPGLRARNAALVAPAADGRQQPRGILRRRVQLRVQQHDLVADADAALDDGEQPARRVRAAVWRHRQHRSERSSRTAASGPQHPGFSDGAG